MRTWGKYIGAAVLTGSLFVGGLGLVGVPQESAVAQASGQLEGHGRIRHALRALKAARREWTAANHDFGGHRAEAVEAVNHAIKQLEVCLKFDKR
jgi:hypothetical protein